MPTTNKTRYEKKVSKLASALAGGKGGKKFRSLMMIGCRRRHWRQQQIRQKNEKKNCHVWHRRQHRHQQGARERMNLDLSHVTADADNDYVFVRHRWLWEKDKKVWNGKKIVMDSWCRRRRRCWYSGKSDVCPGCPRVCYGHNMHSNGKNTKKLYKQPIKSCSESNLKQLSLSMFVANIINLVVVKEFVFPWIRA